MLRLLHKAKGRLLLESLVEVTGLEPARMSRLRTLPLDHFALTSSAWSLPTVKPSYTAAFPLVLSLGFEPRRYYDFAPPSEDGVSTVIPP